MTRVVEVRLIESCIDSAVVKEVELDQPLDEDVMGRLSSHARLQYFPDFPRPYFRIDRPRAYVIQGVMGNTSFRVTFSPLAGEGAEQELCSFVEDGARVQKAVSDGGLEWHT